MKLGIMQPYFFPYIGYYALISSTDKWVAFDSSQYTKRTWMNRNRIMKSNNDWHYFGLPVISLGQKMKISEAKILDKEKSFKKILNSLLYYKNIAPYYEQTYSVVSKVLEKSKSDSLLHTNISSLSLVCDYLNIPFNYQLSSDLNIDYSKVTHAGQWALEISKNLKASYYINPIGGKEIFKQDEFEKENIDLSFLNLPSFQYQIKNNTPCLSSLSIIDVMMWNPPEAINQFINNNCTFTK